MNNFCENCGSLINLETGTCPKCTQPKKVKNRKVIVPIVAVVLAVVIAVGSIIIVPKLKKSNATSSEYTSFSYGFTDVKITDEASVIEAINSVSDVMGITDVDAELKVANKHTIGGDSYYKVQQYYEGIPVYGKTISVAADKEGNGTALTSNYVVLPDNLDLTPNITYDKLSASLQEYLNITTLEIEGFDDGGLIVYETSSNKYKLAYNLTVNGIGLIVDANTADILSEEQIYSNVSATVSNKDENMFATGWKNDNGSYHLYNDDYKISVFDLQGIETVIDDEGHVYLDFTKYKRNGRELTSIYSKNGIFDDKALTAMNEICKVSDYYKQLEFQDFDTIHVGINDSFHNGTNARGGGAIEEGERICAVFFGSQFDYSTIDVIAHEYTHGVSNIIVNWNLKSIENCALWESCSDVFGILYEGSGGTPDWELKHLTTTRNFISPQNNGYYAHISDIDESEKDFDALVYKQSTIVSHAAYLMWNGIDGSFEKIDSETLAKLWFRTLFLLQSNVNFSQFRNAMELSARIMIADYDLNIEQYKTIQKAFDEVGIYDIEPLTYNNVVKNKFSLIVLNNQKTEDVFYNVRIFNTFYKEQFVFKEVENISSGHTFKLSDGLYHIEITDSNKDNALSEPIVIRVLVNGRWPTAQDTVKVHTDFIEVIYEQTGSKGNEATDSESTDTDLIKELTEGYWEQGVQSKYIHKFNSDGTGMVYGVADILESDGSFDMSKLGSCKSFSPFTWEVNGNYLNVYGEGESTTYKWVSLSDDYAWDEGIRHHLPENEKFFYETSYVPDEYELNNALYLKRYHEVKKSDAEIYSEHLKNGGIEKYIDTVLEDYTISYTESCLIDINNDGISELLLCIYLDFGAPLSLDLCSVLLGIQNDEVVELHSAYDDAVSGGGEYLSIKYDTIIKKHVVHYEFMAYDGSPGVLSSYKAYTYDGKSLSEYVKISMILETDGDDFKIDDDNFKCKINDEIVTKSQYENAKSRFEDPTDKTYKMKLGTSNNPLGL